MKHWQRMGYRVSLRAVVVAIAFAVSAAGCDGGSGDAPEEQSGEPHTHTAPRGGTLVELGNHEANLEIVFDPAAGSVSVYVLDAHAENAIRSPDASLPAVLTLDEGGEPIELQLEAVASSLTGETVGDSSHFTASSPRLVGAAGFTIKVDRLVVRGAEYRSVEAIVAAP